MKIYYTTIPCKTADEAVKGLVELEATAREHEEFEVRDVIPIGQKALVVYVIYDSGVLR